MEGNMEERREMWRGKIKKNLFFQEQIRREVYVTNEIIVEQELRRAKQSSNYVSTTHLNALATPGKVRRRVRGASWGGRESLPPNDL